ncbi:hypothetical protein D3C83_49150 [compost metagenome]
MKLPVRVEKNVLYQIVHFRPWHTRQQDAVHERRVKVVKTFEPVPITFENCPDEHDLH